MKLSLLSVLATVIILLAMGNSSFGQSSNDTLRVSLDSSVRKYLLKDIVLDEVEINGVENKHSAHSYYKKTEVVTIDQLMERLPGVWMMRRGNYAAEPVVHGLSGGRLNITIDGTKIYGACTDNMDPISSYIEPDNLSSVAFSMDETNGNASGSSNMSLNFNTKKARLTNEPFFNSAFTSSWHSVTNGSNHSLVLDKSSSKYGVRSNFTYRKHGDYRVGKEKIPYSGYEKLNLAVNGVKKLSTTAQLRGSFITDHARNIGYPALPMDVAYARAYISSMSFLKAFNNSKEGFLESKAYVNIVDHLMDDSQREVFMHMDMPGNTLTAGLFNLYTFNLSEKSTVKVKAEGHYNFSHAEMTMFPVDEIPMYMLTWPDVNKWEANLFGSLNRMFNPKQSLFFESQVTYSSFKVNNILGIKQFEIFNYDVSQNKSFVLPVVNLRYAHDINMHWSYSLSLGHKTRVSTISELYGYYLFNRQDGYDYMGNPELKPEKSLGLFLDVKYTSEQFTLEANSFYQDYTDYIMPEYVPGYSTMTYGALGVKEFVNLPGATLLGANFMSSWMVTKKLSMLFTGSYSYGRDDSSIPLPQIPPFEGFVMLKYSNRNFNIQVESNSALAQNRISEHFNELATEEYTVYNFRLEKLVNNQRLKWKFSGGCENLMDKNYRNHLDWGNLPRPGRNFYLGIKIEL